MSVPWGELIVQRLPELWTHVGEHLSLTGAATGAAVVLGVPAGILCSRYRKLRGAVMGFASIVQTIPSLAMLAILLGLFGMIGAVPAIIALTLYALLPIIRNTLTGLEGVPEGVIEAARGVGMTGPQQLWLVKIPLALPVIVAGIRTAAVISVGIATLSAFIGAGGLGEFINRGLSLDNPQLIVLGAVPAAALALFVDFAIWAAEWGMRPVRQSESHTLKAKLKRPAFAVPALLIVLGVVTSLTELPVFLRPGGRVPSGQRGKIGTIRIGTKEFGEQILLGEMMAQLIEARTRLSVDRRFGLGGTMICHRALVNDQIDLYAEYTGTGYQAILKRTERAGPYTVFRIVHELYRKEHQVEWLEPFGFNNTYTITVRRADAEANGWKNISDLAGSAGDLRAGFTSEFMERTDGYPGLQEAYGFGFGRTVDLSPVLMCEALAKKQVDVICAFATDGRIPAYDLYPLRDDRGFFPPYDAAPIVRVEALRRFPQIREALSPLAGLLDDKAMQRLNYEVEGKKRPPAEVAREFLRSRGLIE